VTHEHEENFFRFYSENCRFTTRRGLHSERDFDADGFCLSLVEIQRRGVEFDFASGSIASISCMVTDSTVSSLTYT